MDSSGRYQRHFPEARGHHPARASSLEQECQVEREGGDLRANIALPNLKSIRDVPASSSTIARLARDSNSPCGAPPLCAFRREQSAHHFAILCQGTVAKVRHAFLAAVRSGVSQQSSLGGPPAADVTPARHFAIPCSNIVVMPKRVAARMIVPDRIWSRSGCAPHRRLPGPRTRRCGRDNRSRCSARNPRVRKQNRRL